MLVATFSATLLTGLITSLKSAPEEVVVPRISFERQDDFLRATADQDIETWQYVGPKRHSTCDETIFDNFLGFGQTFKTGDRKRLDYYQDNGKYYCFKAVSKDGVAGFGSYSVSDLAKPVIVFKQTKDKLTASLGVHAEADDYTSNWQYVLLNNRESACSERSFPDSSINIVDGNTVDLITSQQDLYYCFRLTTIDDNYVYQIKVIAAGDNTPIIITPLQTTDKLYLLADQEIKDWAVATLQDASNCDADSFDNDSDYHLSRKQAAAINLDLRINRAENYCIRAQNTIGIYSYEKYTLNKTKLSITVEAELTTNNLNLKGYGNSSVETWQITAIEDPNDCQSDGLAGLTVSSRRRDLAVEYPGETQKTYCWQASNSQDEAYAAYSVPAANKKIATYRINNRIVGHSLYPQMSSWQYVSRPTPNDNQNLKVHCSETDFEAAAYDVNQPTILFTKIEQYCFRAIAEGDNYHYGAWFTANLRSANSATDDTLVVLADKLQLTNLGKFIFYQAKPELHEDASEIEAACGFKTRTSCYTEEDGRIHIFERDDIDEHLQNLKKSLAEAARWNYLSAEQRSIQDLELLIIYQQNKTFFDDILPSNFYANQFFEDEFLNNFHNFLMTHETEINLEQWQQSWKNYRQLLFN